MTPAAADFSGNKPQRRQMETGAGRTTMFNRQHGGRWVLAVVWGTLFPGIGQPAPGETWGWVDARVLGPFVCRSEFPVSEIQPLLGELERLQADLVATLEIPPAEERIEVHLFRGKTSYDRFLARRFPNVTYRRALYLKDGGPGMVLAYRSPELENDLRHECTHALLHAALPMVPLWLDEGLAKYYEVPRGKRAFEHPYCGNVRWMMRWRRIERVEDLEKKNDLKEMRNPDYCAAWAWVHFMLHGPAEGRAELVQFLADIRSGVPAGLFSQRLRQRVPGVEGELADHFRNWHRQEGVPVGQAVRTQPSAASGFLQ